MSFNKYLKESLITEKSNKDVIDMFIQDTFPKDKMPVWGTKNLKIVKQPTGGWSLVNYDTALLYRSPDGELIFNETKYSPTTSKIQNYIKGALKMNNVDYETVSDQETGTKLY